MKGRHGGARPGAGRKKGIPNASTVARTIEKEAIRELVRQRVVSALGPMLEAQIDNAQGIKHLMLRDPKTGKFERLAVSDDDPAVQQAQIDAALASGNAVWIYTKDPSVQAFTDLMNRTIDKPKEQEQDIKVSADEPLIAALLAGRKRASERRS